MQVFIECSDIASDLFLDDCSGWQLSSGEGLATCLFWLEAIPDVVPLALHIISNEGERSVAIIKCARNSGAPGS